MAVSEPPPYLVPDAVTRTRQARINMSVPLVVTVYLLTCFRSWRKFGDPDDAPQKPAQGAFTPKPREGMESLTTHDADARLGSDLALLDDSHAPHSPAWQIHGEDIAGSAHGSDTADKLAGEIHVSAMRDRPFEEMRWQRYRGSWLAFNGTGFAALFSLQLLQDRLPGNP